MLTKRSLKIYFFAAALVTIIAVSVSLISASFHSVPSEIASKILESTIQLDGVLFGFTAIMFTLIQGRRTTQEKKMSVTVFVLTSFFCYLLSLGLAFSYWMQQLTNWAVIVPAGVAIIGGLFSSVYIIIALMQ